MLNIWSSKGGVGCSTIAAAMALVACQQRSHGRWSDVLLVDLGGDLPMVLGVEPPPLGLTDWLIEPLAAPDALTRIEIAVMPGLQLLPLGSLARVEVAASSSPALSSAASSAISTGVDQPNVEVEVCLRERSRLLFKLLAAEGRLVVVDTGRRTPAPTNTGGGINLLRERACDYASDSILVTRLCYLGIRSAAQFETPNRVAVVAEPGRSLTGKDVVQAVGAPVDATVRWDPAIARSVDCGLVLAGVPRALRVVSSLLENDRR